MHAHARNFCSCLSLSLSPVSAVRSCRRSALIGSSPSRSTTRCSTTTPSRAAALSKSTKVSRGGERDYREGGARGGRVPKCAIVGRASCCFRPVAIWPGHPLTDGISRIEKPTIDGVVSFLLTALPTVGGKCQPLTRMAAVDATVEEKSAPETTGP